jgi:hypothetical protein
MAAKKKVKIIGTASGGLRRKGRGVDHLEGATPRKKSAKKKPAKKKK